MSEDRPNILHLFTDMQRFDTIRALGNTYMKTPNLDRLCGEGIAFTNAYSPTPVCIAARCAMIFGQYPLNTGCYENVDMPTDGRQTFMEALRKSGYSTYGIGKCHFTPDTYALRGFEGREVQEECGVPKGEMEKNHYIKYLYDKGYTHLSEAYGIRGEMYYMPQPSQMPAEDHPTQWVGDRSIQYIREHKDDSEPWYLFSSYIHPHPPLAPPVPWHKLYRPGLMPLPNMPSDYESLVTYINRVQNRYKYRDQGMDKNLVRTIIAYYYACVSFIDYQIGRILDTLEETGRLDNTMILFTSDHGELLGDYSCYGKRSMHDPSARVPMIVRMPGRFDGGGVCDTPVSLVDVAPTFLAAAGAEIGTHSLDGVDMYDIAEGNSDRKYVFGQISFNDFGMGRNVEGRKARDLSKVPFKEQVAMYSTYLCVSREWKYFYSTPDNQEFLFDKIHDPNETRNKKGILFARDALRDHKSALVQWLQEGGETAGLDGDDWKIFPKQEIDDDPDTGLLIQDGYTPWIDMEIPGYTDSSQGEKNE
jgi:arylsulfatase A-like enzyme